MTRRGHSLLDALLASALVVALGLPLGCALPLDANMTPARQNRAAQASPPSSTPRRVTPNRAVPDPEQPDEHLVGRHRWLVLLGGAAFISGGATALALRAHEGDAAVNVGATLALITGATFVMSALFSR